jgi:AcrR family transcriptional regulator
MNAGRTARERARAELTREIKAEARRQLASTGADGLSLRAVARELGLVSSALYRYFPSRDELLTALITDAYNALGAAVETAVAGPDRPRDRWRAGCHAVRDWARDNRHEYALLYGSPVPGYQAPSDTVPAAARVPLALVGVLRDAHTTGEPALPLVPADLPAELTGQLDALAEALGGGVGRPVLFGALLAWTQLFGIVSFELFGQLVGSVDPAGPFFAAATDQQATLLGL